MTEATHRTPALRVHADVVNDMRGNLLRWYDEHQRDLPWRRADDPYAVWVSEMMLQQTRVATVIDYYERWMARFPTVETLAAASVDDVLGQWQGLGYYARARRLHEAARVVVERHGGVLPSDVEALEALPGVGRYTAGAIGSIAFGLRVPLVDGNVARVLARRFGIDVEITRASAQRQVWGLAGALADGPAPGALNQAMMELGATLCSPRSPRCLLCPLRDDCVAHATGREHELPVQRAKSAPRQEQRWAFAITDGDGRLLVARRRDDGLLGGLWELPISEAGTGSADEAWRLQTSTLPPDFDEAGALTHVFTHMRWDVGVVRARCARPDGWRGEAYVAWAWVDAAALAGLATSRWMARALALLAADRR